MSCTLNPIAYSEIMDVVEAMPDSPTTNIIDSVISKLESLDISMEELQKVETFEEVLDTINYTLEDMGRPSEDVSTLKNSFIKELSRRKNLVNESEVLNKSIKRRAQEVQKEETDKSYSVETVKFPDAKKQTHRSPAEIISELFPKTPWVYEIIENRFRDIASKHLGHDPVRGTLQLETTEVLQEAITDIEEEISKALEDRADAVELMNSLKSDLPDRLQKDPDSTLAETFAYKMMQGIIPHLLTSKSLFNNDVVYDASSNTYHYNKDTGSCKTNHDDILEYAGLTFTGYMHLNTTPQVVYDEDQEAYVVIKDKVLTKGKLDEAIVASGAGNHPGIAEVDNVDGEIGKYLKRYYAETDEKILQALYIKFFAEEPVPVIMPDGTRVEYKSLTYIQKNSEDAEVRALAKDILTNLQSNIFQISQTSWINYKDGGFELQNIHSNTSGELASSLNNILKEESKRRTSRWKLNGDVLSLTHNGKKYKFRLSFDGTYDHPVQAKRMEGPSNQSIKEAELLEVLDVLGFNLGNKGQKFVDMYNQKYKVSGNAESLIGTLGYISFLNTLPIEEAQEHLTSNTKVDSSRLKELLKEDESFIPYKGTVSTVLNQAASVYQELFDLQVRDQVKNSENNLLPAKSLRNFIADIKKMFRKKDGKAKTELLENNPLQEEGGSLKLEHVVNVDAYYDEDNPDGIPQSDWKQVHEAKSSIFNGFMLPLVKGEKSLVFNPLVASDKSTQFRVVTEKSDGKPWIVRKGSELNQKYYFDLYQKHITPYWLKQEDIICRKYSEIFGTSTTTLSDLQSELIKNPISFEQAQQSNLKQYIHYTKVKKSINGEVQEVAGIRPDLVAFVEMHKPENIKHLKEYLQYKKKIFASQLSDYKTTGMHGKGPVNTAETSLNLKLPEEVNQMIGKTFGTKWADGDVYKDGEINPMVDAYWWMSTLVTHGVETAVQGNVFQFKPGKSDGFLDASGKPTFNEDIFRAFDEAIGTSAIDQTKRASSTVATKYKPVLAKPGDRSKLLPRFSNRIVINDIKAPGVLLADGTYEMQEAHDGAVYAHELEYRMMMHSYGNTKSPLRGRNLKDHTVAVDTTDSTNTMIKKATHVFGPYEIANAKGGSMDFEKLNRVFLKGKGFDNPYKMEVAGQVGEYTNYYQVYEDLMQAGEPDVFGEILNLMAKFPETKGSIITRMDVTTSVKQGVTAVNTDFQAVLNEEVPPIISQIDNSHMGIQLNTRHGFDEGSIDKAMAMITQVLNSTAAGGVSTVESENLFDSIALLSDYLTYKEFRNGHSIQKLLEDYATKDTEDADFLRKSKIDGEFNLNHPRVRKIAISQGFSNIEKARVKIKFNGGQYVVRNTNGTNMLYDIPTPKGTITMTRQQAENYVHSPDSGLTEADLEQFQRNLKWVDFKDVETGESITNHESFQKLHDLHTRLNQAKQDKSPDVSELEKELTEAKISYRKVLATGNWISEPGEILLPFAYKETFKLRGDEIVDEIVKDPNYFDKPELFAGENPGEVHTAFVKALQGIAARIPGSGKQSGNMFKVAGFYPPEVENTIGIPIESMLVKGEDLDIDKANVMLFSVFQDGTKRATLYPFATAVEQIVDGEVVLADVKINDTGSGKHRLLTKEEFKNHKKTKKLYEQLEEEYGKGAKDWYEQGALNYITDVTGSILNAPKNAVEANTKVSTDDAKSFASKKPVDGQFTHLDPARQIFFNTLNKMGKKMVGIEATALKAYLALYHSTQKGINEGRIDLYRHQGTNSAFRVKFNPKSLLGKGYYDLANTRSVEYALIDTLTPEMREELSDVLEKEFRELEEGKEAWEWYSQLVNAATDNGKDPILGKLGIDDVTGNLYSAAIAMGVPFDNLVKFFEDDKVRQIVDITRTEGGSLGANAKKYYRESIIQKARKMGIEFQSRTAFNKFMNKHLPGSVKDLIQLDNYGKEYQFIGKMLKINGGVPHNEFEYFKTLANFDRHILDTYKLEFSMISWLKSDNKMEMVNAIDSAIKNSVSLKNREHGGRPLFVNPLRVLMDNSHYMTQMMAFVDQMEFIQSEVPRAYQMHVLARKAEDAKHIPHVTEPAFNRMAKLLQAKINAPFFTKYLPSVTLGDRKFDLTTNIGKSEFVRYFPTFFQEMERNVLYRNNRFLRMLKVGSFNDLITGEKISYIKPIDPKTQRTQDYEVAQADLGNLEYGDIEAMFAYATLMSTNLSDFVVSFGDMFTSEHTELVSHLAEVQKDTVISSTQYQKDIEQLIPELYTPKNDFRGKTGNVKIEVEGKTKYLAVSASGFSGDIESSLVHGKYKGQVLGVSVDSSSLGRTSERETFEMSEGDAITGKTHKKLHENLPFESTSRMTSIIKGMQESIEADSYATVNLASAYEMDVLRQYIKEEYPDFKIVNANEVTKGIRGKNVILNSQDLTQEQQAILQGKSDLIKLEVVGSSAEQIMDDALHPFISELETKHNAKNPILRKNRVTDRSGVVFTNNNTLIPDFIDSSDGIILTNFPEEYNMKIRDELFGIDADMFMKHDKLVNKKTKEQFEVIRVTPSDRTVMTPIGSTITLVGHTLQVKSRNGERSEMFVPSPKSLRTEPNPSVLKKVSNYFKTERQLNDGNQTTVEKGFYEQFTFFGEDIDYGFAMMPDMNAYNFQDVFLDESSFYTPDAESAEINSKMLKGFKSSMKNVKVLSSKVYEPNERINAPNRVHKRYVQQLMPLAVDRKVDGDPVNQKIWNYFAKQLGAEAQNSSSIQEDPEMSNDFLQFKTFRDGDKIIVNLDNTSIDTPISNLTQIWLRKLAESDNNLYNDIIEVVKGEPLFATFQQQFSHIDDVNYIAELAFEMLTENRSELSNDAQSAVNEYSNFVNQRIKDIYPTLTADMSATNIARRLKAKGVRNRLTLNMLPYDRAVLEEFHGDGMVSFNLQQQIDSLIKKGKLQYKCNI